MPERDAEDADVIRPSVAGAEYRFRGDLVSDSEAWREMLERGFHVSVHVNPILARDQNLARIQILEPALVFAVHRLREVNLPAQAIIDRQLGRNSPGVLRV